MAQKSLSTLEQQVMNLVWGLGPCSVKDVHREFNKDRKIAYTTIATILQRLQNKGLVKRIAEGNSYIYSSKLSKEKYSKSMINNFLTKFVDSFGETAIASFAESVETLPAEKRKYFLKLLEEHEKTK